MRYRITILLLLAPWSFGFAEEPPVAEAPQKSKDVVLAVIVNPKNPIKKLAFGQLRAYLKARKQFWPGRVRCDLYLPRHTTDAYKILLKKIYKMSHKRLQKYWVRKLFSGDMPAKPSTVPNTDAAGKIVRKYKGALTVVPADQVPKGVKVLPIDGKKPGDKDYPLVGKRTKK